MLFHNDQMELVIPDVLDGDTQRKRVKLKKIHPYKARREELVIKLLETVSINLFSLNQLMHLFDYRLGVLY
jgi:hypothetical protein